mmetsp:Transcript_20488/g.25894  ORF Transcript_20488/g.25894 Transcript_20488/m.25894 type:complete len:83 (-) Transcript_20488:67-315(-)
MMEYICGVINTEMLRTKGDKAKLEGFEILIKDDHLRGAFMMIYGKRAEPMQDQSLSLGISKITFSTPFYFGFTNTIRVVRSK